MTIRGTIRKGKIELDDGSVPLPDGTPVRIEPIQSGPDPADGLGDDAVHTGIANLSEQHDLYVCGMPGRL